jgi:Tol biopolymer transport system component/DNA-binding winged helix-turn-helix (wHTH) protein
MNGTNPGRVKFGPFEADLHTHEIWKFGVKIKLIGQPFEVLAILISKPGELVTREELRERLWPGDTFVDFDHGLNAAVNKLREALSDSVETPRYVETLPRRGYRFVARVAKPGEEANQPAPVETPNVFSTVGQAELQKAAGPALIPALELQGGRPRWLVYLVGSVAGLGLVVVLLSAWLFRRAVHGADPHLTGAAVQRIRPLTNLAEETSEPAFSPDGNFVAFRRHSDKRGVSGIYVKEAGSEEMRQITSTASDCCPAWAPDGRTIAFARFADNNDVGIFLASTSKAKEMPVEVNGQKLGTLLAGTERRLDTKGVNPTRGDLTWAPNGKSIAFSSHNGIAILSMENGSVRLLTTAPPQAEDWGPVFSPDGEKILFVRSPDSGIPEELMMATCLTGEVTRVASQHARILGPPQWAVDGNSVIFSSDFGSHPGLWRANVDGKSVPVQINDSGWRPAVARNGYKLAYQRITHSLNIWELELQPDAPGAKKVEQHILVASTSETDQGPGPQISPDGKKLAFMSDRTGTMEIWVSDRDGSNPVQVTAVGSAGTPRWSPDSQSVAFDASEKNGTKIYKVKLGSGVPQLLTPDEFENRVPSWSHDGKWVYFASTRTNSYQVWKVPAEGGTAVQLTKQGGHAAIESADGKLLYYAKTASANPEIWQVPVDGGAEKLVSQQLRPFTWASWGVTDQGIVFAGPSGTGRPVIRLYEPATRRITALGELDTVPFWFGVSRDARSAVFDQPGWQQSQIMLVENFR